MSALFGVCSELCRSILVLPSCSHLHVTKYDDLIHLYAQEKRICAQDLATHKHSHHIFAKTGLLKVGTPQPWPASKKNLNYVREAGVRQFISTYNRVKDFQGDELMWGDEVEYGIFVLDGEGGEKRVRLSLRAKEVRLGLVCAGF